MNKRRFVRFLLQEPYSFVILLRNIIHPLSDTSRCALNYVWDVAFYSYPMSPGSASGRMTCYVGT